MTVAFSSITQPGNTTLTSSSGGPAQPAGFALGNPPMYYEVSTTATFSGGVTVCIDYTGIAFTGSPQLFHQENGAWVDRTTSVDPVNHIVCGQLASFSFVALFERAPRATYVIERLYDSTKTKKSGSAYPIKVSLRNGAGQNVSSPSIVLHAVSVTQASTNAVGPLDDTGTANPDFDFRYDASLAGYIFNLSTKGISTGTYNLNFTVGSDPTPYSVPFAVK